MADDPLALIVGRRWSLPIVAALLVGPLRFSALRAAVPGISANLLTRRLRELVDHGLVTATAGYALTDRGRELAPFVEALRRWTRGRACPAGGDA